MRLHPGDVLYHRDFQHWRMEIVTVGTWCCHVRRIDLLGVFKHVTFQVRRVLDGKANAPAAALEDGSWIQKGCR